jgi:phosphoribosylformimino-5-aminoimidazole carboxamide ribotide isomerase
MFIYPAIDILGGRCVRLRQGDYAQSTVFHDDPAEPAKQFFQQGADRLHLVDLDGAKAGKPINGDAIRRICDSTPLPCQLGGGLRTEQDLATVFGWGVRWAVVGTRAAQDPAWLRKMAEAHPGRIVLGLDARDGIVATDGWTGQSRLTVIELAKQFEGAPLAAIVFTDIAKDGMMAGPNFESTAMLARSTAIPVIASGGVSDLSHVARLRSEGVFGAIIGRALYEGQIKLPDTLPRPS